MNEYIKQISDRIRELRDILDLTAEEVSSNIGVSVEEYLAYENGEKEIPISLLYKVAGVFKVDPTVLMTGDVPRMEDYTVEEAVMASRLSVIPAIHSALLPSITSTDRWIL